MLFRSIAALATSVLVPLVSGVAAAGLYIALFVAVGVCSLAVLERHIVAVVSAAQADRVRTALQELKVLPLVDPEVERNRLAETIWNASRADEGTISATGANVVADAIMNADAPEFESRLARRIAYEQQLQDLADADETAGR